MITTKLGIVASSQPLASQAGAQILTAGGNAIDAAIAANAVLGLTEPMMNGIGGDLFAIVYEAKTGKVYGLNASGWAASGVTADRRGTESERAHAAERRLERHRAGDGGGVGRVAREVWHEVV